MDIRLASLFLLLGMAFAAPDGGYPLGPKEYYIDMPIDHFSSGGQSATYKMRYIVDAQYWDPQSGPILFYSGNEGKLENFYLNSGFLTKNLSVEFKGLLVFGEHRYFGKSFPFTQQYAYNTSNNTFLTVEQAMADYNLLIKSIRYQYGAMKLPCIVFGGSYGGMLASWLRMKYPQTFQGALASSAPILYFKGATTTKEEAFGDIITEGYKNVTSNCSSGIKEAWGYLMDIRDNRTTDYGALSTAFNTCQVLNTPDDINNLYNHLMNGFSYMAMTNYPYPTSFLTPMPASPVNVSCKYFADIAPLTAEEESQTKEVGALTARETLIFKALLDAANVYFNDDSATPNCTNFNDTDATGNLDGYGWNVMACNELAMPTTNGPNSMFINNSPFDYDAYTASCQKMFNLTPRYDWIWDYFGGQNPQYDFQAHTNIIFSNGELDPWRAGGVNDKIQNNDKIHIIYIPKAAHHLDLREQNAADPIEVQQARDQEIIIMRTWIAEYLGTA